MLQYCLVFVPQDWVRSPQQVHALTVASRLYQQQHHGEHLLQSCLHFRCWKMHWSHGKHQISSPANQIPAPAAFGGASDVDFSEIKKFGKENFDQLLWVERHQNATSEWVLHADHDDVQEECDPRCPSPVPCRNWSFDERVYYWLGPIQVQLADAAQLYAQHIWGDVWRQKHCMLRNSANSTRRGNNRKLYWWNGLGPLYNSRTQRFVAREIILQLQVRCLWERVIKSILNLWLWECTLYLYICWI